MQTDQRSEQVTRGLLAGGVIAGPVYVGAALIQGAVREGFDFTRHSASLLSNGELGWIQVANFLLSGLLVMAGAAGMWSAMQTAAHPSRSRLWGPALTGIYGLGLIGAGIFAADPADGFPPGTPAGSGAVSLHGLLHFISGGVGFLALIGACFVFAARFTAQAQPGWAAYSAATGLIFLAAFFGIASGPARAWTVIGFWIGLTLAWTWISAMSARLMAGLSRQKAWM